ncbi:hypothetical protein GOODEAATRI_025196 [Goodea atripinnis]|uniref:Uncharacterized protein n=1 Tax=Goodea atripinnis TaxID=208336 RepID=A0ABV0NN36_9TELE
MHHGLGSQPVQSDQSSSSLCRRLLDLPFWFLFFLNDVGPPSSPSEVMTRSLNLGLGSGGRSAGVPAVPSSVWGSCKSTGTSHPEVDFWDFELLIRFSGLDLLRCPARAVLSSRQWLRLRNQRFGSVLLILLGLRFLTGRKVCWLHPAGF